MSARRTSRASFAVILNGAEGSLQDVPRLFRGNRVISLVSYPNPIIFLFSPSASPDQHPHCCSIPIPILIRTHPALTFKRAPATPQHISPLEPIVSVRCNRLCAVDHRSANTRLDLTPKFLPNANTTRLQGSYEYISTKSITKEKKL